MSQAAGRARSGADLDSDQAYRFAQDYNGIGPVEPVQVEEWQTDPLPRRLRRPYCVRSGVPKIEVVGRSKEKVEEIFWEAVTQARAELAGVPRK